MFEDNKQSKVSVNFSLSDIGQSVINAGKQEWNLEDNGNQRNHNSHLFTFKEETLLEPEKFLPSICHTVHCGQKQAQPAQF